MTREVNTILNQSARRWTWRRWTLRYRVNLIKIMSKQSKLIIWLANALNVNNLRVTVYLPSWRQISFGVGKEYKEQSSIYVDAPDSDSDIISIIWAVVCYVHMSMIGFLNLNVLTTLCSLSCALSYCFMDKRCSFSAPIITVTIYRPFRVLCCCGTKCFIQKTNFYSAASSFDMRIYSKTSNIYSHKSIPVFVENFSN